MMPALSTRGPISVPASKRATRFEELVGVVAHVARAGYAVGEVEHAVDVAEMLVVVPQARHQESAVRHR